MTCPPLHRKTCDEAARRLLAFWSKRRGLKGRETTFFLMLLLTCACLEFVLRQAKTDASG